MSIPATRTIFLLAALWATSSPSVFASEESAKPSEPARFAIVGGKVVYGSGE